MLVVACGSASASSDSSTTSAANTVHMNETQFVQSQITIKKGQSVTLVNDASVVHIIQNGTWDSNGNARPGAEPGAPKVQQQFSGNDTYSIGPFNTAGTFQYYCTFPQASNLTVIVQSPSSFQVVCGDPHMRLNRTHPEKNNYLKPEVLIDSTNCR